MTAFADTGFYIALLNPRDRLHGAAKEISAAYRGSIVTTEFVLMELGNFFSTVARQSFAFFLESLRNESSTTIVPSSTELFARTVELYAARLDKD